MSAVSVAWSRRRCSLLISSVWSENPPGNLHHRNQKLNPHLRMLPDKSPARCRPGPERLTASLLSAAWGERPRPLRRHSCLLCLWRSRVKSSANFGFPVPSVEAPRRGSSRHRCRAISQSKQVVCLAAQQKDNVTEPMCTRSRAPPPVVTEPILSGPTGVKWKDAIFV